MRSRDPELDDLLTEFLFRIVEPRNRGFVQDLIDEMRYHLLTNTIPEQPPRGLAGKDITKSQLMYIWCVIILFSCSNDMPCMHLYIKNSLML